ncbi:HEAT repeat domain-containing protein [Oceanobacter kriegii]|uniref:HEAT repeat domain-containing protein n=1 Tax=Oceanobacter kriegii TaxID=64972 RepID=UPI00040AC4F8|nr:HEAT repeat domain-containing protein [Oceanobacter kriegii]
MALVKRTHDDNLPSEQQAGTPKTLEELQQQLQGSHPLERRQAAQDIVDHEGATALLLAQLERETSAVVRQVILTSLTRIGDRDAVFGLAECLRSEDARLRNDAIEAMKEMPDQMAEIVEELLADDDPDVRIFTVNILESLRHPHVEQWLIDVLDHDDHLNVVCTALDLMGEVGTEAAIPALQRVGSRYEDEAYVQFAADMALKRIQSSAE